MDPSFNASARWQRLSIFGLSEGHNANKSKHRFEMNTVQEKMRSLNIFRILNCPASPDFNAIETVWKIQKDRLDETMPTSLESRADFIKRLHGAVRWGNTQIADQAWHPSANRKERADDCLAMVPPGGRTKW